LVRHEEHAVLRSAKSLVDTGKHFGTVELDPHEPDIVKIPSSIVNE
jgi:hypothetical protein